MPPIGSKILAESVTLLASAARTATNAGAASDRMPPAAGYAFMLDVTAAATDTADTLDVFVQTLIGDDWIDVVHFTQVLGDGGAKRYISKLLAGAELTEFETGSALAAAAVRHLCGDQWRVRYDVVDSGDADQSFTFSVVAIPM